MRLSRHLFMAGDTDAAEVSAQRAVMTLEPTGHGPALAHASLYEGAILAMTEEDRRADGGHPRVRARAGACAPPAPDLAALSLNYLGIARVASGDAAGVDLLRESIAAAEQARQYEYAARGYCNLAELLFRAGRARRARGVRGGGHALRPRARLLVARLRPRAATAAWR